MKRTRKLLAATALLASLGFATPAFAATSTRVVIMQDQKEVPATRIQLFDADTGAEVKRDEDEDAAGVLFLLDGGSYRVVVDGYTVQEIAVSGTGSETFNIGLTPWAPAGIPMVAPLPGAYEGQGSLWDIPPLVEILFGAGQADLPQTGTGFRREGPPGSAPETFAQTTRGRVSTVGVNLTAGLRNLSVNIHYSEGDASNIFDIPGNSGVDSGVVYGDDAPSGSSGIATPFGLSGTTEVDQTDFGARVDIPIRAIFESTVETSGGLQVRSTVTVFGAYDHVDRDYSGSSEYSGGGGGFIFEFSQDRQQEVSEDYFSLGLAGRVIAPLGGALFGHLTGSAGGYYRDSDLTSVERNLCNFCPVSDRDFAINIEDSDDGFGFRGQAGAGLELRLSPNVSLYAGGSADYWSSVGAIFNPNSGDQVFFDDLNTALRTEDSWSWQAGGGIIIRFGGR